MKHLSIQSTNYQYLEKSFKEWLTLIGYSEKTITAYPRQVRELFHHLEQKNITHLVQIKSRHIYDFIKYITYRKSQTTGTALSASHINGYIQAINTFAKYVNQTGKHIIDATPRRIENHVNERTILSKEEVKQLYEITYEQNADYNTPKAQRDRAMIAILYGCGLRRQEASRLNITDIDLIKQRLFVRKGKGNKQRYVPIANKNTEDIRTYIEEGRNWFFEHHQSSTSYKRIKRKENTDDEALFINAHGQRLKDFCYRVKQLGKKAGIEKEFTPHSLRHSIATHLLQSGMKIEDIARFLGHSSLDSTQIYLHIVNQLNKQTDANTELLLLSETRQASRKEYKNTPVKPATIY